MTHRTHDSKSTSQARILRALLVAFLVFGVPDFNSSVMARQNGDTAIPSSRAGVDGIIVTRGVVQSVSVHDGAAVVTRLIDIDVEPGQYELRVSGLPALTDPQSLQVYVERWARVDQVDFVAVPDETVWQAQLDDIDQQLALLIAEMTGITEQLEVLDKEAELYDSIAEKTAAEAGSSVGTAEVDLDEVMRVAEFLSQRHADLLSRRRSFDARRTDLDGLIRGLHEIHDSHMEMGPALDQQAVIILTVPSDVPRDSEAFSNTSVRLTYIVEGAAWRPTYTIRLPADTRGALIDLDVLVQQTTGEDWNDVLLSLSTEPVITPTRPPTLEPVEVAADDGPRRRRAGGTEKSVVYISDLNPVLRQGTLGGKGTPVITYDIIGKVTIPSNAEHPSRVNVTSLRTQPALDYVAAPLMSQNAYVRGNFRNSGRFHMLPGPASVFVGDEFTGEATMPYVGPGGEFTIFLGPDRRVTATRKILSESNRTTGLLADGRETTVNYRLTLLNRTGRPIDVELWDRMPQAADDRIKVGVSGISENLSRDADYRRRERKEGLLRWDLRMDPSKPGGRERNIEFSVVISHHRDVTVPEIPR